jgi:hypothetical protein
VLSEYERQRLAEALVVWLDGHPGPDEPAFRIGQEQMDLSPRQIVSAVLENDHLGQQVLGILEYGVRRTSLEGVARSFERHETEPPPAATTGEPASA